MGIIGNLFRRIGLGAKYSSLPWDDFWYQAAGTKTAAGVNISADSAMRTSAVYACVRVLAETLGSLPKHVYRRDGVAGEVSNKAYDHPLYRLIHDEPNPAQTSFEFFEMMMGHVALRGNAYARIQHVSGYPVAFWPIHPGAVTVKRGSTGIPAYEVNIDGRTETLHWENVLHIRGLSDDGLTGLGPLQLAREQIGASRAADDYSSRFFANDGTPTGCLVTDQPPPGKSPEEVKDLSDRIRADWKERQTGDNRHSPAVLFNGLKWVSVGINPEDAQMLDTRKYNALDIARVFRMQPHKIGIVDAMGKHTIEEQNIEFATDTMRPWCVRWEQAMNRVLLSSDEKKTHYIEINIDGLLRGNIATQSAAFAVGRQWGWLSVNDVRQKISMNPIQGGDEYLQPLNMVPLGENPAPENKGTDQTPAFSERNFIHIEANGEGNGNGKQGHH